MALDGCPADLIAGFKTAQLDTNDRKNAVYNARKPLLAWYNGLPKAREA